jgi:hypothetical protein
MDTNLAGFLTAPQFRTASRDAAFCYLLMRADIALSETQVSRAFKERSELVSGLSVSTIAERAGLPEITARRCVDELVRAGWAQSVNLTGGDVAYRLGVIQGGQEGYYAYGVQPGSPRASDSIREHLGKCKEEIAGLESQQRAESRKRTNKPREPVKNDRNEFIERFQAEYEKRYGEIPTGFDTGNFGKPSGKIYANASQVIEHAGDLNKATEVMQFVFENWLGLQQAYGFGGTPGIGLMAHPNSFALFLDCLRGGIKKTQKGIGQRGQGVDWEGVANEYE